MPANCKTCSGDVLTQMDCKRLDCPCFVRKADPSLGEILKQHAQDGNVNHPPHYKSHPSGIECIEVTEHMNFCLGNAVKYIWRCGEKGKPIEDLKKARWYLDREIARRTDQGRRAKEAEAIRVPDCSHQKAG